MAYVDSSVDSPRTTPSSTSIGSSERLKVVIVGGSVAGLTLAHCLRHNNIDFVVLEAGPELAPQVGASIVVCSNGARILDQLGIYDDIEAIVDPLQNGLTWTGDGKLVINSNAPVLSGIRTGYPFCFLTRRNLLKIISDHLPADRSNIYTSKRVSKIEQTPNGVTAFCEDGTSFSGDVLVGTDGVRSSVRAQMFKNIEAKFPGATENDQKALSAEYNCIFGFGEPVKGHVVGGDSHRSYAKEHSTLSFVGADGRLFWFLFSKLDKRYFGKDIPRYTQADLDEAIKPFFDIHMTDEIKFKEIWEARTFANMVCVEEGQYEHWTDGRLVCVGDSIHKMTPNLGAGGNAAIESAAALANSLSQIKGGASASQIEQALKAYQTKRRTRANEICTVANGLTRIEALDSFAEKVMALYIIPLLGDFLADVSCDGIVGAEILDALPVPARSLTATMAWNPEAGVGKKEKKWRRALWALPLLAVLYGCNKTMGVSIAQLADLLKNIGSLPLPDGTSVAVPTTYFGIEALDKFISIYVTFFTPSIGNFDIAGRWQAIAFLGDLIPLQAVWMIEGIRRGNFVTAAHLLPTLFGLMYQVKGIGFIAPVYFFLHYVQSPLENYHAADNRLTQVGPAKTIIPTIILTYIAPTVAMFTLPALASRQWINGLFWQPFPIYAAIMQKALTYVVTDTTQEDRIKNPEADMPHLRKIYSFTFAAAAISNLLVRVASPVSLANVFFKYISSPSTILPAVAGIARSLRYDQLATFGAASIWLGLHFKDLKKSGKLTTGWSRIVGVYAGTTLLAGPGAAMVAMWSWREEVLCRTSRPIAVQRAAEKAEQKNGLAH